MPFTVTFNGVARKQFLDAALYYHEITPNLGARFEEQVDAALVRLSHNPYLHATRYRDIRFSILKRFPFKLFYHVKRDQIEVLALLHHSRDERPFFSEPGNFA
jgi:plasmid stabilization system protein ParE